MNILVLVFTLLINKSEKWTGAARIFFKIFVTYYHRKNHHGKGFYRLLNQIIDHKTQNITPIVVGKIISFILEAQGDFFDENKDIFGYNDKSTRNNILMILAKLGKDDVMQSLLTNQNTSRHVTHATLEHRNIYGQTLITLIGINR